MKEKVYTEYESNLKVWIATKGECRAEGFTEEDAIANLYEDIEWSEANPDA